MYHEIERKFLIQDMPRLRGITSMIEERYFLQHGDLVEERIQNKDGVYEYEMKTAQSPQDWRRDKRIISKEEFTELEAKSSKMLLRENFLISAGSPRISIMKYKGEYRGLEYVEIEFDSRAEMEAFTPLSWMGTEITNSRLGRDAWLLGLDREHFLEVLRAEKDKLDIDTH